MSVQVPAVVEVTKVPPFTKQGPVSEMLAGAPDPVVVNKVMEALAGAETVPPAGHAALPCTPMEMGSAPGAGRTLTAWVLLPLMNELLAEKSATISWLPGVVGFHVVDA